MLNPDHQTFFWNSLRGEVCDTIGYATTTTTPSSFIIMCCTSLGRFFNTHSHTQPEGLEILCNVSFQLLSTTTIRVWTSENLVITHWFGAETMVYGALQLSYRSSTEPRWDDRHDTCVVLRFVSSAQKKNSRDEKGIIFGECTPASPLPLGHREGGIHTHTLSRA